MVSYTFEGGTATDQTTNGYHGTNNGSSITTNRAKFGIHSCTSNNIIGSGQFVSLPSLPFIIANGLSFSLWIFSNGASTAGDMKIFEFTSEKLMLWSRSNGISINFANGVETPVQTATWNHIVVTITSASAILLYVNNVQKVSQTLPGVYPTVNNIPSGGRICRSLTSGHGSYKGNIDNFKMFNKILTPVEITALYENTDV